MKLRFLLSALLPLLCGACLNKPSPAPTLPPVNLAADCPALPQPPAVLIDPERSVWELQMIALYGECARKHQALAEAWPRG